MCCPIPRSRALALPWSFAVILMVDTGSPILFVAGIIGTYAVLGFANGPAASFTPEIFPTRYRYTGAGLAFNLGGIIGGAIPPTSAGVLMATFGLTLIEDLTFGIIAGCILAAAFAIFDRVKRRQVHS